jgi:hypothetical protein
MKKTKTWVIVSLIVTLFAVGLPVSAADVVNEDGRVLLDVTDSIAIRVNGLNEYSVIVDRAKLPIEIRDEFQYIGNPSYGGVKYNLFDPYVFVTGGLAQTSNYGSRIDRPGFYYSLIILYDGKRKPIAYGEAEIDVDPGGQLKIRLSNGKSVAGAGNQTDGGGNTSSQSSGTSSVTTKREEGLVANEKEINMTVGGSTKLKVYYISNTGKELEVTANKSTVYRTNAASVASVATGGLVKAGSKAGQATITVSYNGKSLEIPVTVKAVGVKYIAVTPAKMTLGIEQSKQIKVQAIMDDNTRKDVTKDAQFFSNDTEVADVEDGDVSGIGVGETTIAVNYEGKEKEVVVEVQEDVALALEKLEISEKSVKLKASQQMELYVTGVFEDDSRDDVTGEVLWQSSKGSVATVTDGILVAKGIGVATITASLKGMKVQVKVTVEKAKKVKSLAVSKSALSIVEGQTATVKVTATYVDNSKEDVTSKVIWNVIDSDVVDVKSGKFYALELGTTKVTGKFDGKLVTVNVNVK